MDDVPKRENNKPEKKKKIYLWPIKAFFITLSLAIVFSLFSEFAVSGAHIAVAVTALAFLIAISILFDVLSVAFATCDKAPFNSMASRKIKGAKKSLRLLKNADIVASVCGDIIGDVCGIVSGAAGGAILLKVVLENSYMQSLVAILISSFIAAITVSGKAAFKRIAMKKNQAIVLAVGKMLSLFSKE